MTPAPAIHDLSSNGLASAKGYDIRPLQGSDRSQIQELLVATGVFTSEEVDIALELVDAVLTRRDQQDYIINVCSSGDEVLGYYCIGPTPATQSTFDLYWIATKPSVQGSGVGQALDEHATDLIRTMGGTLIIAETSSQPKYDRTRKFYVKRGYIELARIRAYYRADDDLVVYGKYLS